ncbi:MAG: hypothetical protein ACHQ53_08305 [Polyangiales bacterium]
MRANSLMLGLLLLCCTSSLAAAQMTRPSGASPIAPANAGAGTATATPATAAVQPTAAPQTEAAPAATAAAAAAPSKEQETARFALQRERLRALLAAERARQGNAAPAAEAEPAGPRRYGDAGSAIAIGVSFDTPFYTKASYDLFSDKDVANRYGLWAAHDIAALRSDTFVALEVGWGTEHEQDGNLRAGTLGSELTTHAFFGGAQLRYVPLPWLQPHARLAAGAQYLKMQLTSSSPTVAFKDSGWTPFASLGLGVTVRSPTRLFEDGQGHLASLSVGLMLEGGYTLAQPLDLSLSGPGPGARGVPIVEPKLGRLDRSGPYARASIVVRF